MVGTTAAEKRINEMINELGKKLPKFSDGRINYTGSDSAPVVNVVVKRNDKVLILKRGDKVANYKGRWSGVAGFLDKPVSIKEKALEELSEETGINESCIDKISVGTPYELSDKGIGITWHICPVLVEINVNCGIKIDWEHTEYRWVVPDEVKNFDTVPGFERAVKEMLMRG